jgi:hypothetical protein
MDRRKEEGGLKRESKRKRKDGERWYREERKGKRENVKSLEEE